MFADNFKRLAKTNTNFRKVLYTGQHAQIVAMCLKAGEDIGAETHPAIDQTFLIIDGEGTAMVGSETHGIEEKSLVFVPADTPHNITTNGHKDMKLLTIYAPPAHPDGTVQVTKPEPGKLPLPTGS